VFGPVQLFNAAVDDGDLRGDTSRRWRQCAGGGGRGPRAKTWPRLLVRGECGSGEHARHTRVCDIRGQTQSRPAKMQRSMRRSPPDPC